MKNNTIINYRENSDSNKKQHQRDTTWFTWKDHSHSHNHSYTHNHVNTQHLSHQHYDVDMLEE